MSGFILITGASSGFGEACARRFAKEIHTNSALSGKGVDTLKEKITNIHRIALQKAQSILSKILYSNRAILNPRTWF